MSDALLEQVTTIVAEALDRPRAEVTPTASLIKDLGAESLDFVDLTFRIESAFGIKIVENDLWRSVDSVTDISVAVIVAYLQSRGVGEATGAPGA